MFNMDFYEYLLEILIASFRIRRI